MNKIIQGAEEAVAVARGEIPAARITINGHAYVLEASLPKTIAELSGLLRASRDRLRSAIEFAHAEGFEWPSDPLEEFVDEQEVWNSK